MRLQFCQRACLELTFAFDEIVLTNTLKKQKQAIRFPTACNEMRGSCCYLIAASHLKHALIIGITRARRVHPMASPQRELTEAEVIEAETELKALQRHALELVDPEA